MCDFSLSEDIAELAAASRCELHYNRPRPGGDELINACSLPCRRALLDLMAFQENLPDVRRCAEVFRNAMIQERWLLGVGPQAWTPFAMLCEAQDVDADVVRDQIYHAAGHVPGDVWRTLDYQRTVDLYKCPVCGVRMLVR